MVTIVVAFNISTSIILLGIAWKIWRFRQNLVKTTNAISMAEDKTYSFLSQAPIVISGNQQKLKQLETKSKVLYLRTQYLQQIISSAFLVRKIWNRYLRAVSIAKPVVGLSKI